MPPRRPRAELVPNANNPRLLMRLLGLVATGIRRPRVLAETLDVELRTVHYYTQAAQWLGLLEEGSTLHLSPRGLEVAFARPRRRTRAYAEAVWRVPFVMELLGGRTDTPSADEIAAFILAQDPEMAPSTARRRASAVRSLIGPAIPWRPSTRAPHGQQLGLPLHTHTTRSTAGLGPALVAAADLPESPDVYARLLMVLLDHGELATQHVRAILDHVGGGELPLGTYIQMAIRRGDALRTEHGLAATAGAARRREVAGDPVLVALTDPEYRAWLEWLLNPSEEPGAVAESRRRAARFARWDLRIFGQRLKPETVAQALEEALPGRSLRSLPAAGLPGLPLLESEAAFLQLVDQPRLGVALPSSVVELAGGVAALNPALQRLRTRPGGVRLPSALDPRVRVHGGLFRPGAVAPRALADNLSLRLQALEACPAFALLGALGLLARRADGGLRIEQKGERVCLRWRERRVADLVEGLVLFGENTGWCVLHPPSGGLRDHELVEAALGLGVLHRTKGGLVLAERLFQTLLEEPEARLVYEALLGLEDRLHEWLEGFEGPDRRGARD